MLIEEKTKKLAIELAIELSKHSTDYTQKEIANIILCAKEIENYLNSKNV